MTDYDSPLAIARRRLYSLLNEAYPATFERSHTPRSRGDLSRPGGRSDPTAEAALDPLRIELSHAYDRAKLALDRDGSPAELGEHYNALAQALAAWEGH